MLALSLRHQLVSLKIRVVEVLPPPVDTNMNFSEGLSKMAPEIFATLFLSQLSKGKNVINVGQSLLLEKISRLSPAMAFRMVNKKN